MRLLLTQMKSSIPITASDSVRAKLQVGDKLLEGTRPTARWLLGKAGWIDRTAAAWNVRTRKCSAHLM